MKIYQKRIITLIWVTIERLINIDFLENSKSIEIQYQFVSIDRVVKSTSKLKQDVLDHYQVWFDLVSLEYQLLWVI